MNNYLECLQALPNVHPNFWVSREYFLRAGLRERRRDGYWYIMDDDIIVLPPVNEKGFLSTEPFWSDFEGMGQLPGLVPEFLDHEYIYRSADFLTMEGGKWEVFRKNSRKFLRRHPGDFRYEYYNGDGAELFPLLEQWLSTRKAEEVIQDDATLINYMEQGWHRKVLIDGSGAIYGVNIWDTNYQYINFRYCICLPGDFLSEYMRLLFYLDTSKGDMLVNDGGSLDNPSLERFKDKMNPFKKRNVYSWRKI